MHLLRLIFIPSLYLHLYPRHFVERATKIPFVTKRFKNKFDMTCWFSQAYTELYFQTCPNPPVPAHHPSAEWDDWQRDCDLASLFLWSDTESNNNGTVVADLQAHTLFPRGQEVKPAEWHVTMICRSKRNIETLFSGLLPLSHLQKLADFFKLYTTVVFSTIFLEKIFLHCNNVHTTWCMLYEIHSDGNK